MGVEVDLENNFVISRNKTEKHVLRPWKLMCLHVSFCVYKSAVNSLESANPETVSGVITVILSADWLTNEIHNSKRSVSLLK